MSMLAALPDELQLNIFENFCDHCNYDFHDEYIPSSYQPLLNLCLTSKSIRPMAQDVLFHNFRHLDKHPLDSLTCFAVTLHRNPNLANKVLRFSYIAFATPSFDNLGRSLVEQILRQTKNLQELQVHLHWCPKTIRHSSVKRLHIYNPYSAKAKISAISIERISTGSLRELSINGYTIRPKPYICLPLRIRRLSLIDVHTNLVSFVKLVRPIEWFQWIDNAAESENPPDILAKILPWGKTLKEIHIQSKSWAIDCKKFHHFPLLRKGRLRCPIINQPRGRVMSLPSGVRLNFSSAE
ncbi:hypothetical protein EDB81DRAFT_799622 [Dactylonectria macrodidyma]|uniref:Uncharacterized protein n=1 Tax=Dactylonectria macrodidyma TaxID=307937 RepID=A0A9P9EIA6_9HYPO|nr:hypothetical protein EDB81DRAFT_799622 [Dactylonectria macrodidyma]